MQADLISDAALPGPWSVPDSIRRASAAIGACRLDDDPLFPLAVLRGLVGLGLPEDRDVLLRRWTPGITRETGAIRYRWMIDPRFAQAFPDWVGPQRTWEPWRAADAVAWDDHAGRGPADIERLTTPLILADSLEWLARTIEDGGDRAELARSLLEEAMPKIRRDAAGWILESRAWADTWALWALARRPAALTLLHPFAEAIAGSYAASAERAGGVVLGTRFPFHGAPLVSGSAQLAAGLVALGIHPNIAGDLIAWVRTERRHDGGWGDHDGSPDLLTTLVAAESLSTLDPTYDTAATAAWFASRQRTDGWWRACGPEATWLTVEILAWLRRADRPFAERFAWPQLAVTNRDRRTGLPFYGYFADLERLFDAVPGLAASRIELAFIDLAGFGQFNNAYGMAMGDAVLRTFAKAIGRIPGTMAIRDGGDEFIVLGPPTGQGLPDAMDRFRQTWAVEFREIYGEGGVAPRILTVATVGASIVDARNDLGRVIADLKEEVKAVGPTGIQRALA